MFVLKPTGTIYYSLGLAAEKPAGSSTDLLFFPAFLLHFFSTFRLKTKLSLSLSHTLSLPSPPPSPPPPFSSSSSSYPPSSFLQQQSRQRLQCVTERAKRRKKQRRRLFDRAECLFTFVCFAIGRLGEGAGGEEGRRVGEVEEGSLSG